MAQSAGGSLHDEGGDAAHHHSIAGQDQRSDADIFAQAAAALGRPKAGWVSSFVLHAPLELLARAGLLPLVEPGARVQVHARMLGIGRDYAAAKQEAAAIDPLDFADAEAALARLRHAIDAGDAAGADACVEWLSRTCDPLEMVQGLTDLVLPRLSAAAHGSIFLYQIPRVAPRSRPAAAMARNLVRLMAESPTAVLTWQKSRENSRSDSGLGAGMLPALCRQRRSDYNAGGSIQPMMAHVEANGLAASIIGAALPGLTVAQATRDLLRVAARSMLQDDPQHAPYGWSHCLTMPQAALGIARDSADPAGAMAIAGTYVLGFRVALGAREIDPTWVPASISGDARGKLDGNPGEAAAGMWFAMDEEVEGLARLLATRAAVHADAHLAKYTLACFDATAADPGAGRLYLAAAAYLGAWWRRKAGGG